LKAQQIELSAVLLIIALVPSNLLANSQQQLTPDNARSDFNFNVSNNTGDSIYPAITSSGNNVYIVWQDDYFGEAVSYDKKNYDIFFGRSTDGGYTFKNVTNLSNNIALSGRPIITAFGEKVYVVWIEDTFKGSEVWFRKSINNGSTFGQAINLGRDHDAKDSIVPKSITAFGSNVYVVWRQLGDDGKTGSILFRTSKDSGDSFGEIGKVSDNAVLSSSPKVGAFGNNVYIVWDVLQSEAEATNKSPGIFLAKSSDGGINFEDEKKLNGDKEFGEGQVAASSNQVFVAWTGSIYDTERSIDDIFFTISYDNGNTFGDTNLINKDFVDSENVELSTAEGRIDAVWQDKVTGNGEIFYRSLNNNSKEGSVEGVRNLSNTEGLSECPSIATSGDSTYVVWEDSTYGNHEIFFKKLTSIK
jgi:hypothetical protein